jgi:hypothetical protein
MEGMPRGGLSNGRFSLAHPWRMEGMTRGGTSNSHCPPAHLQEGWRGGPAMGPPTAAALLLIHGGWRGRPTVRSPMGAAVLLLHGEWERIRQGKRTTRRQIKESAGTLGKITEESKGMGEEGPFGTSLVGKT